MGSVIILLCVVVLLVFLAVLAYRGSGMARYALKRILLLIPTVLIVCVIVFILLRAVPTSAVDYMIYQFQTAGITVDAAQIVGLMMKIQEELGLTYIFIGHDLSVVRHISNTVAVMYLGKIMELTTSDELYEHPLHILSEELILG